MCGIAGLINFSEEKNSINSQSIYKLLKNRGPDARGESHGSWYSVFHTRLSIIEKSSASNQPMIDKSKRYLIVFNGEIYNFREINSMLLDKYNLMSETTSDTEALLNGYRFFGLEIFKLIEGIFAGVILDLHKKEVIVFRDRFAVKPLYFFSDNKKLYFGSTPGVISELRGGLEINKHCLSKYLALRSPGINNSFFNNLEQLPSGYVKLFSESGYKNIKYWTIADLIQAPKNNYTFRENAENIKYLMKNSVEIQSIADVELSSFLSGGIDSSIIFKLMSERSIDKIPCYTFSSLEAHNNEVKSAKKTSLFFNGKINIASYDFINFNSDIQEIIKNKGGALTVANEYAIFKIATLMKKDNIKVAMSGEGSDEIFLGYTRIFNEAYTISKDNKFTIHEIAQWIFDKYSYVKIKTLIKNGFKKEFIETFKEQSLNYIHNLISELTNPNLIESVHYFFLTHHLQTLLSRLDNGTMSASIEGRVPFLNNNLLEFALSIPYSQLISSKNCDYINSKGKIILLEAFNDLPKWVVSAKKVGFKIGKLNNNHGVKFAKERDIDTDESWHIDSLKNFLNYNNYEISNLLN